MTGTVEITGGVGGAEALADWFEHTARLVDRAGSELAGAQAQARTLHGLVLDAGGDSPATTLRAEMAVEPFLWGRHALPVRAAELEDLAIRLRAAARGHRSAEAAARAEADRVAQVAGALGAAAGELGPVPAVWAATDTAVAVALVAALRRMRHGSPFGQLLIRAGVVADRIGGPVGAALRTVTGPGALPKQQLVHASVLRGVVMPFAGSWLHAIRPGWQGMSDAPLRDGASGLVRVNTWAGRRLGRDRDGLVVTRRDGGPDGAMPTSAAECLELVALDQPVRGAEPGRLSIRRAEHDDGTTSWLVTVPGTQDWMIGTGENVYDTDSNLRLVADEHAASVAAVTEAMVRAGIGPGDDVVLAGHSQGGLVATDVAVILTAAGHAGRVMAVTAGSPVGAVLPPGGQTRAQVLAFNHAHDAVTGLQVGDNPTGPNVVTVERDLLAEGSAYDSMSAQHDLGHYVDTARRAEGLDDVSFDAQAEHLAELLGADRETVSVTHEVYVAHRPEGAPEAKPPPGAGAAARDPAGKARTSGDGPTTPARVGGPRVERWHP